MEGVTAMVVESSESKVEELPTTTTTTTTTTTSTTNTTTSTSTVPATELESGVTSVVAVAAAVKMEVEGEVEMVWDEVGAVKTPAPVPVLGHIKEEGRATEIPSTGLPIPHPTPSLTPLPPLIIPTLTHKSAPPFSTHWGVGVGVGGSQGGLGGIPLDDFMFLSVRGAPRAPPDFTGESICG